jgi:hypothetical protein
MGKTFRASLLLSSIGYWNGELCISIMRTVYIECGAVYCQKYQLGHSGATSGLKLVIESDTTSPRSPAWALGRKLSLLPLCSETAPHYPQV